MRPRQLFAPSAAGSIRNYCLALDAREKSRAPEHRHQPEFESFAFSSAKIFSRDCFERFRRHPAGERGSRQRFHPLHRWRAAFQFRRRPLGTGAISIRSHRTGVYRKEHRCGKIGDSSVLCKNASLVEQVIPSDRIEASRVAYVHS